MRIAIGLSVALLLSATCHAQLAFEVASVKPSSAGPAAPSFKYQAGGRLSISNCPLYSLIAEAYGVNFRSPRLTGGPQWTREQNYDIEAAAPEGAIPISLTLKERQQKMRSMLQQLLSDRFNLVIRREPIVVPVYALMVSKEGLKLSKTPEAGTSNDEAAAGRTPCHCLSGNPNRGLRGEAFQMSDLLALVEFWTDRPAIDGTGVQGEFDLPQTGPWTQSDSMLPSDPNTPPPPRSTLPTFLDLFRQFGLKLESQKSLITVLEISRVERPSSN
jgi:uncharacterized protein (TIGR03435 family)